MAEVSDRLRKMRMAVAGRMLGLGDVATARNTGCCYGTVSTLVRDALEMCGLPASNDCRLSSNTLLVPEKGVYFIGAVGLSAIKVGWSADAVKRFRLIEQGLPVAAIPLAMIRGAEMADEKRIHRQLRRWHQKGEWFRLTESLVAHLRNELGVSIDSDKLSSVRVLDG